jgi:1,4-alpha-glucan branching enzyme
VLSFLRHGVAADGTPTVMACIANFSGDPKPDHRVGLPVGGRWREVLDTASATYGGGRADGSTPIVAVGEAWHGQPVSAVLRLAPLGVLWLAPEPFVAAAPAPGLTRARTGRTGGAQARAPGLSAR